MINIGETPLAKIAGQMLLSMNTDVSTQSLVLINVQDDLSVVGDRIGSNDHNI